MSIFRKIFDTLVEHDFRWASTLLKVIFWWAGALLGLIVIFYGAYRMKGMLSAIPPVIQAACLFLIGLTAMLMAGMFRERGRALAACERFLSVLEELKPATDRERAYGLSREKIAFVRQRASILPGRPREWWRTLEESLERYTSLNGEEGWFITDSVPNLLPEVDVIDPFFHVSFHQAVPGILTALGLLATFVAILTALAGVSYNVHDPIRPVSGIDQLINGLSGKFLSSIIALILSVVFTLAEKRACERPLGLAYESLIRRCRDTFPLLTQSRILLDIQRIAMSQIRETAVSERG